jgi:hypothetical protein
VKEDFRLRAVQTQPEAHSIELGRIEITKAGGPIIAAANPWLPTANEIDTRYRPRIFAAAPRTMSVGLVVQGDEATLSPTHLAGFQFFVRELEYSGVRADVFRANDSAIPKADLIYVTADSGFTVPAATVKKIGDRVSEGSWLFVDPCGSDTGMIESFRTMTKAKAGAAEATEAMMLGSRFVFGTAPPGAFPTRNILWGEHVLLSPRDYGCAWAGRRGEHVFQRDLVRAALEFGVNAAFCIGAQGPLVQSES